ncbi:hypothetical protein DFJ74DRAFT_649592 [Hyaloraphidium curvatum]|nr:hypothetical protein DFJ74DRAFT_649592 [Hyaloraphidium curvatum]
MGFDIADASVALAQCTKQFASLDGVPTELLLDQALAWLAGTVDASDAPPPPTPVAPRPAPATPGAPRAPPKPILKATMTPDHERPTFFASARNWLTSHLPTSVSTIGNTFANTLKSPSFGGDEARSGLDSPLPATPSSSSNPPPVPPKAAAARANKRVRFSFHDISFPPPPEFDEHEPTFGLQSSRDDGEPGPSGASSSAATGSAEESEPAAAEPEPQQPLVRKPPGEMHTAAEVYQLYMSECDRRREQAIPQLIEDMQEAFARESELLKLDLTGTVIDKRNVYPLAEILSVNFGLRQLSLEACGLDDDCLKIILNNLLTLDRLPWLNLSGNRKLSNNGLKFVAIYVKKSRTLRYLDLSRTALDKTACTFLTHALSMGPVPADSKPEDALGASLEVLKLEDCKLKASQLEVLATGIAFSNLHYLSLRHNQLDANAASWVAEMIRPDDELRKIKFERNSRLPPAEKRRKVGLGCLDMRENDIKSGVAAIAQALALNTALKQLVLRENKIDSRGLEVLAEMLKVNHGLTSLDLSVNPLGGSADSRGIENLKDALALNKTLEELSLSSVGLTSEAAVTLAEALPLTSTLSRLDLTFNPIDVAGLMGIAASLKMNGSLTNLEVAPVLKQHKDSGGALVEEDPEFTRLLGDIGAQCEKNAVRAKEAEDARLAEMEREGRRVEDAEREEEEEEERQMILDAQRAEKERLRKLEEQRERAEAEKAAGIRDEPPIAPRKFDADTILQDFGTARESFQVLQEMMDAGGDAEVLEQLYLQCTELEARLLAAVNNNFVSSEKLLGEILALNDRMRPVMQACEAIFVRGGASPPPVDRKGKSPALPRPPLPPKDVPAGSSADAAMLEETPLIRRRPESSGGAKPAADRVQSDELSSFLKELDDEVGAARDEDGTGKELRSSSSDHLVEDIDSLLKEEEK